nr:bZIP transcription factor 30-like [Lolium perenne]
MGVKEEAVGSSSQTPRLGKNTVTTGAGSSASMPQPTHSSAMVAGSKKKKLSSSGAPAGSGIHSKDHNGDPMFNQDDIHKILADKGLKDIVEEDPKRVRGILNNRRNSNKSSKKRKAYLSNLEHKVDLLQQQKNSLSAEVISLQV